MPIAAHARLARRTGPTARRTAPPRRPPSRLHGPRLGETPASQPPRSAGTKRVHISSSGHGLPRQHEAAVGRQLDRARPTQGAVGQQRQRHASQPGRQPPPRRTRCWCPTASRRPARSAASSRRPRETRYSRSCNTPASVIAARISHTQCGVCWRIRATTVEQRRARAHGGSRLHGAHRGVRGSAGPATCDGPSAAVATRRLHGASGSGTCAELPAGSAPETATSLTPAPLCKPLRADGVHHGCRPSRC